MPPNLNAWADELAALADMIPRKGFRDTRQAEARLDEARRRMLSLAETIRRAATVTPNAKPTHVGTRDPVSGGRAVTVVRTGRRR